MARQEELLMKAMQSYVHSLPKILFLPISNEPNGAVHPKRNRDDENSLKKEDSVL